jgi:hypothetical protein
MVEGSPNVRQAEMIRGIAAEKRFLYEIMLLCPVITLTSLDELRKIRGIQTHKRKDDQQAL